MDPVRQTLCDFLYYGYLPSREAAARRADWWGRLLADPEVPRFRTASEARDLLARIVEGLVGDAPRVKIGVTAGYDSRGVLGALVSVLPPERIVAFTRGQPGNKDFEKARDYTLGVLPEHHLLLTQKAQFDADRVVEGVARHPTRSPRGIGAPARSLTSDIEDFDRLPNLSGYLGDALSGKHLTATVRGDFEAARVRFLRNNRPYVPGDLLEEFFPHDYDPAHVLPTAPMLPVEVMDPQDQLNFHYRQFQRIRLSAGQYEPEELAAMEPEARRRAQGQMHRSRTPYTDPRWQKSFLLQPFEERLDQRFYHRFLAESYPEIFPDLVDSLARTAEREAMEALPPPRPSALRRLRRQVGRLIRATPLRPMLAPAPRVVTPEERRARSARRTHTNWEMLYEENAQFRAGYADPLIESLAARRGLWFDPRKIHALARDQAYGYGTVLWGLLSMETAIRAGQLPDPG